MNTFCHACFYEQPLAAMLGAQKHPKYVLVKPMPAVHPPHPSHARTSRPPKPSVVNYYSPASIQKVPQ